MSPYVSLWWTGMYQDESRFHPATVSGLVPALSATLKRRWFHENSLLLFQQIGPSPKYLPVKNNKGLGKKIYILVLLCGQSVLVDTCCSRHVQSQLLLSLWLCNTFSRNMCSAATKSSQRPRIRRTSVVRVVVTARPQCKPMSHSQTILITHEEDASRILCPLYSVVYSFLPPVLWFVVWPQMSPYVSFVFVCVYFKVSGWQHLTCRGSPVMSMGSVTRMTSGPLAQLFMSLKNTWGFTVTPTLKCPTCVITLLWYVTLLSQLRPHGMNSANVLYDFQ